MTWLACAQALAFQGLEDVHAYVRHLLDVDWNFCLLPGLVDRHRVLAKNKALRQSLEVVNGQQDVPR